MFRFRRPHVVLTLVLCFVAIPMLIVSGQRRNAGFSRENGNVPATNLFNVVQSAVECQAAASPATTQYTFNNAVRGTNDAFFSHATKNNLLIAVASSSDPATITMFSTGYTQVFQQPATTGAPATGAPAIAMFYKISDGSETTATFNFSASTRPCIGLIEYSGASINAPLHGKSLGYNGSGTVVALGTGTIDIISANDLGVAFFANNTNTTTASNYTAPPGGLFVNSVGSTGVTGGSGSQHISMFYVNCIVGGCPTTTSTTTTTASSNFGGFIASFYPATTTSAASGTGSGVSVTAGNSTVTFVNATGSGTTTAVSIDPLTVTGTAPSGTTITSTSPAYDISTTSTFSGNAQVCIHVTGFTPAQFANLKLLHKVGSSIINVTSSLDVANQKVCGLVTSFSPFVVANGSTPTAATVSIGGRALTSTGAGIRNATVVLRDQFGNVRAARTSAFGYYEFEGVQSGQTYVLSVNAKSFTFLPRVVNLSDGLSDVDLIASP